MLPHRDKDRGAAAVELALVLPILLLLLMGIVEFGQAYYTKIALTAAARDGARALALGAPDWQDRTRNSTNFGSESANVTVTANASPCVGSSPAEVTASYPVSIDIPFWGSQTLTVSSRGAMRCEG